MLEKSAFSITELAEAGPFSRSKLYEAIRDGELVARKHGKSTIVLKSDWQQFLDNLPVLDESTRSRGVPRKDS